MVQSMTGKGREVALLGTGSTSGGSEPSWGGGGAQVWKDEP